MIKITLMKSFYSNTKDAIRYALSDGEVILVIGAIMLVTSIANKFFGAFHISTVIMFLVVGYGSFISWHTINGSDTPPKIRNVRALFWEGFRKSVIIGIYSLVLTYLHYLLRFSFEEGFFFMAIFSAVIFAIVWIIMIGGLVNRCLNNRKFLKAFHIPEIIRLIFSHNWNFFVRLMISALIAQIFVISVCINFHDGFSLFELFYSILTFFLAPFLFIATKRLIGLHAKELLN